MNSTHRAVAAMLLALALLLETTDVDLSNPAGLEVELFGFGISTHAVVIHSCWPGAEWDLYGTDFSSSDQVPQLTLKDPDDVDGQDRLPSAESEDDDCAWACVHVYEKVAGDPLVNHLPDTSPLTPPPGLVFHPPPSIFTFGHKTL